MRSSDQQNGVGREHRPGELGLEPEVARAGHGRELETGSEATKRARPQVRPERPRESVGMSPQLQGRVLSCLVGSCDRVWPEQVLNNVE